MNCVPLPHNAKQAGQLLAFGDCGLLCARELRGGVGVERLLAHLRELAPVAHLRHSARELARRLGRQLHLRVVREHFLRGHGANERLPRRRGRAHDIGCGRDLGLRKAALFDVERQRHEQQRGNVDEERALDLRNVRVALVGVREDGVAQSARLHQIGFGEAQLRELRLQSRIVEKRDLDGAVGGQRLREQRIDRGTDGSGIGGGCQRARRQRPHGPARDGARHPCRRPAKT